VVCALKDVLHVTVQTCVVCALKDVPRDGADMLHCHSTTEEAAEILTQEGGQKMTRQGDKWKGKT
jgi:hypothetical protein